MFKNKLFIFASLIACLALTTGCKEDEELPIGCEFHHVVLTVNGMDFNLYDVNVSGAGGVYRLNTKYNSPIHVIRIMENGLKTWSVKGNETESSILESHFEGDWYDIQFDEDKNLVVTIKPKEENTKARRLSISYSCIYDPLASSSTISFTQK